jgi:hypothetical protein
MKRYYHWFCSEVSFAADLHSVGTYIKIYAPITEVVVEWLAFLHRIQEVSFSDLGLQTGYPDLGFWSFFSVTLG